MCSSPTAVTSGGFNVGDTNTDNTLQPGESWVFQCSMVLTFDNANDGPHGVHNVATASGQPIEGSPVTANDVADVHLYHPSVTIAKADNVPGKIVQGGQNVTFTLTTVVTDGPSPITVTDVLPAGETYVASSQSSNPAATSFAYDASTRTLSWTYASLNGSSTQTYHVTIDAKATGSLTNTADACVPAFNQYEEQCDQATDTLLVQTASISKTNDTEGVPVKPGDSVGYTLTLSVANGPVPSMTVTDTLPAQLVNPTGFNVTPASVVGQVITWNLSDVTDGTKLTYTASVKAGTVAGSYENTAVIETGPCIQSCSDTSTVPVQNVSITKSNDTDGPVLRGTAVLYTLTLSVVNGPVKSMTVTDVLPAGMTNPTDFRLNGAPFAGASASGQTITWNLTNVADGTKLTYTATVAAAAANGAELVNTATITEGPCVASCSDTSTRDGPRADARDRQGGHGQHERDRSDPQRAVGQDRRHPHLHPDLHPWQWARLERGHHGRPAGWLWRPDRDLERRHRRGRDLGRHHADHHLDVADPFFERQRELQGGRPHRRQRACSAAHERRHDRQRPDRALNGQPPGGGAGRGLTGHCDAEGDASSHGHGVDSGERAGRERPARPPRSPGPRGGDRDPDPGPGAVPPAEPPRLAAADVS